MRKKTYKIERVPELPPETEEDKRKSVAYVGHSGLVRRDSDGHQWERKPSSSTMYLYQCKACGLRHYVPTETEQPYLAIKCEPQKQ